MITAGAIYKKLIDRCALRPLRSEGDLDVALEVAESLYLRLESLIEEESDYLEVLSDLIGQYEAVHYPADYSSITPASMLRWLMEVNGMKQVDLAKVLGVSSGRASEIANGVRDMSKAQILLLAERFNVRADTFLVKNKKAASPVTKSKKKKGVVGRYTSAMAKASARGVAETAGPKVSKLKKGTGPVTKRRAK
jgi:HTH-type transcriptional regulator / antitoxin HigA